MDEHLTDQTTLNLKNDISAALYTYLAGLHSQLEIKSNAEIANDVVLTVLSLNIGHILGQLDTKSRQQNLSLVNSIIEEQMLEVSKLTDIETYGFIGHG